MSEIAMIGGEPLAAGVSWFLDTFMTPLVNKAKAHDQANKEERRCRAADAYRESLLRHYSKIKIFGTSSEVPLQEIFADVYIFEEPLSRIPYEFEALRKQMAEDRRYAFRHRSSQRKNGMALAKEDDNLFILGKPGAGKTTFLKYLTLQAAQRNLNRLPIFVSLNEWANSPHGKGINPRLMPFIVRQFEICHFDEAGPFVEALLRSGQALVLFDGLDEVRHEDEQRRNLTQLLKDFARQYDDSQCLITCRIAASDYAFPGFRDVEVADFTDEQINQYAELWFQTVGKSHEHFAEELAKPENAGVRELCSSPLLLSMVCLYFERVMRFPPNRAELYEKAIEALLNKWDASRDILRDEIPHGEILYRELSPRRKEQMFAAIAARTFETGDYFFRRRDLAKWIGDYLRTLPNVKPDDEIDNNAVLQAIEAQHGIFVERARDIYSFSHLTFQEYFTARYIFDNERRGATTRLLRDHLNDNRWREVFLLTVSLFDREGADDFFRDMISVIDLFVSDEILHQLLIWADAHRVAANPLYERYSAIRIAYIFLYLMCDSAGNHRFIRILNLSHTHALARNLAPDNILYLALDRVLDLAGACTRPRGFARTRALARDRLKDFGRDRAITRALFHVLSVQVGFDYGFYYGWAYAILFAQEWWPRDDAEVRDGMATYTSLLKGVDVLAQEADIGNLLAHLTPPTVTASTAGWQQFADKLRTIMQQRDLDHDWQFTDEQIDKLNAYFYANELLAQCLNVAVVSDRQAILAGLLAPPAMEDKKSG